MKHGIWPGIHQRNRTASAFRFVLLDKMGVIPLEPQAEAFALLDGVVLDDQWIGSPWLAGDAPFAYTEGDRTYWLTQRAVTAPREYELWGEQVTEQFPTYDPTGEPVMELGYREALEGTGETARVVQVSASFKFGKSVVGGLIPASFACTPGLVWPFVGMAYTICEPEFQYLLDALVETGGMELPRVQRGSKQLGYVRRSKRPDVGAMVLELSNGAIYECKSWERHEDLKGKMWDGLSWCEFYQFPSMECMLSVQQNLSRRQGVNIVPSTPDKPIITHLKETCESPDPTYRRWKCVAEIPRKANPWTFDFDEMLIDLKQRSKEKFAVYWLGKSGQYIGSTYDYKRGDRQFSAETHPHLFKDPKLGTTFANLEIPSWWEFRCGADTGTHNAFVLMVLDQTGTAYVVAEYTNYRYVGTDRELDSTMTAGKLSSVVLKAEDHLGGRTDHHADTNSQWKQEFQLHGITLLPGEPDLERRTDVLKEFFQHGRVLFAPWLEILPYELELAHYPEKELLSQRRVKLRDETVDSLEHGLATRPQARVPVAPPRKWWVESYLGKRVLSEPRPKTHPRMGRVG